MGRPVFRFNGVDQYAVHPDWTPNGLPFEVRVKGVPLGGTTHTMLSGENTNNWVDRQVSYNEFRIADGLNQRTTPHFQPLNTVGLTAMEVDGGGRRVFLNGEQGQSNATPVPVDAYMLDIIGSRQPGNINPFHGPIYDIEYIDNSPIQDTDILEGNANRYITIPAFVIGADEDFEVTCNLKRTGGAEATYIVGSAANDDFLGFLSDDTWQVKVAGVVKGGASSTLPNVAGGQHCRVKYRREGATIYGSVDDGPEELAGGTANAAMTFDLLTQSNSNFMPVGTFMQEITLENLTTGEYIQYRIDEGEGTVIKAYDRDGNEIALYSEQLFDEFTSTSDPAVTVTSGGKELEFNNSDNNKYGANELATYLKEGRSYRVTYEIYDVATIVNAAIRLNFTWGATRSAAGTYSEVITAGAGNSLRFSTLASNGQTFKVRNIIIEEVQFGTVTPDASWANIPDNSRFYPANEQTGDKFKCYQNGVHVPALDATIQNFDNANWDILPPGGYGSGPGDTLADAMDAYLRSQVTPGARSDMISAFFEQEGVGTWREFQASKAGSGQLNDWMLAYFLANTP